jgi:hypothetical protein
MNKVLKTLKTLLNYLAIAFFFFMIIALAVFLVSSAGSFSRFWDQPNQEFEESGFGY